MLLSGKISTARSAEFLLPKQLSELVLGGMELGAADDTVCVSNTSRLEACMCICTV